MIRIEIEFEHEADEKSSEMIMNSLETYFKEKQVPVNIKIVEEE